VAATKCDLKALSDQKLFRHDLYYRLSVAIIHLPSLRDRREDVPILLAQFISLASMRYGREVPHVNREQMNALMRHDWPGNVRELRNVAERIVLGVVATHDNPLECMNTMGLSLTEQIDQFERALIEQELKRHAGRTQAVMQSLQLPKKTLYDKLHRYGIKPEVYREM